LLPKAVSNKDADRKTAVMNFFPVSLKNTCFIDVCF